jgi:heme exporter protein D
MNGGLSVDAILALAITLAIIAIMLIIILCIWRRQKQVLANIEEIRSRR